MKRFIEAVEESFEYKKDHWSHEFGEGYELTIEPLIFDQQHYVALYKDGQLILNSKIPVKPGK